MCKYLAKLSWLVCLAGALWAADMPWKTKLAAQWTEEDARQILTASPWAREFVAGIARRLSEDELREGGKMGQPRGIGYDGVDPKGSGPKPLKKPADLVSGDGRASLRTTIQSVILRLRWESALPVRLAGLKAHEMEPTLEGDGYRIAVYGVPGSPLKGDPKELGDPLKNDAALKREGKRDVKPSRVEAFRRDDGWVVVYLFPLSAEITQKDRTVEFNAHIGRIVVAQSFDLSEMLFQGKLEL